MKTTRRIIFGLAAFCCLSCFSLAVNAADRIRLTNGEWPPLLSESIEYQGVISRVVSEAFALEGGEVEYGFFAWQDAYELARSGEWDGSVIWLRNTERARHFLFSDPVYHDKGVFFYLKGNGFQWNAYEDLTKYTFGVAKGYSYGDEFDSLVSKGKVGVRWAQSDEENFSRLLLGSVDACPSNIEIGFYLLRTRFAPGAADLVTYHPKPYTTRNSMHVIFPKKNSRAQEYVDMFNRGLEKLKQSGAYDRYFDASRRGEYLKP